MWFVKLRGLLLSGANSVGYTTGPLTSLLSIIALIVTGEQITALEMFTILSCLNVINFSVAISLSYSLPFFVEGYIAVKRIEDFMSKEIGLTCAETNEEITFAKQPGPNGFLGLSLKRKECITAIVGLESSKADDAKLLSVSRTPTNTNTEKNELSLFRVSASWNRSEDRRALTNVSLRVRQGEMLAVTGPVGSGKSSLLMAILGELSAISGTVKLNGRVAYVPQIPWVFSGTIRDNILFGRPLDVSSYYKTLDVCCMQPDLQNFPKGDLTEIGHRGVSLSGGQRVRVSLARALYSAADVYLLDDPLSAVDAKVGKHLFNNCICGFLSNRTRVFVTHQLDFLTHIPDVIVLNNGVKVGEGQCFQDEESKTLKFASQTESAEGTCQSSPHRSPQLPYDEDLGDQDLKEEEEDRNTGSITWKIYWSYIRTALGVPFVLCLSVAVLSMKGMRTTFLLNDSNLIFSAIVTHKLHFNY